MIIAYRCENKFKPEVITLANQNVLNTALWIDLLNPSKEESLIEKILGLDVPTREEMQEIELSSRLYKENDALFMIVTMVARSDTLEPKSDAVTLILANNKLITIRLMTFLGGKISPSFDLNDIQSKLIMLARDIKSLRDHVSFLSNKINFLLDATLGMINIEQNNIIKIFSIYSSDAGG